MDLSREAEMLSDFAARGPVRGVPNGSPAPPTPETGPQAGANGKNEGEPPTGGTGPSSADAQEVQLSFVVRVLTERDMPEAYQTQLLRALERQVNRRNPLIGWSDLHPLPGPLNLKGIHELLGPEAQ
jgi:hypothetical protein